MTRGRKLSASSIREKVEKILGVDDNPYGLPPVAKDPNTDNKRHCLHDPSCIPFIGKLLPKPKPKDVVSRRRRSSSLPARYQAIYAETAPGIEITPEHFADFDRREKAYYDFFPHLRPCMTVEEYNEEYAKWEAKCNAKHLKKKPLKYYPWERKYGSRELLNPRAAPRPPGFLERPISKALPPLPSPSDARSTCDTDYLISQFPPPPEAIPSTTLADSSANTVQPPQQRQRSSSEGTILGPRTVDAIKFALEVRFAPDIRSKQCHCDDDSYAGTLSRPTEVHRLDERIEPPPQLPAHVVNMFRAQESKSNRATPLPTDITSALEAQLTEWEDEITREDARREAHAEALRKLESNHSLSQSLLPEAQENYAQLERELLEDYRAKVEAAKKDERQREREKENKHKRHVEKEHQRQRLRSEPKLRHGPASSSAASGAQESHRNRQPHEGHRQRKGSRSQLEDATHLVHDVRDRHERKTEKDHLRERNKSEPKRHAPGPSTSSSVAPNNRRERQPDDNTRAGVEHRAQDDIRRRNVRRSVSTSKLHDMVQPMSHDPPQNLRRQANAGAPVTPSATQAPNMSNRGVRIAASGATAAPASTTAQGAGNVPKAIKPRPSRPNLGPPPSLSSGASGHRTRTPSITQRSEEKPPLKERVAGVALNRKASNSSLDPNALDKSTISAPVRYIKGAESGLNQLRHARLHVQDLQVTMVPLQYKVQYPSAPESIASKAGPKGQTTEASGTSASSQATNGTQLNPTTPPPTQTVHIFNHTVDDSPSSASSYGSSSSGSPGYTSSSHYGGYAGSSTTTLATHYGYAQRSYEDFISPAPAKIIPPGSLRTGNSTSAEPLTKKTSLTPMHVPLPKTGTLTGGAARPVPQVNAFASSSRDVIDNIPKNNYPPANANSDFEDEELIRGYRPRKFVDVKKLIQEERDRVHRERKELPDIPFPVSVGDTAPLRIHKKASQLQV